MKLLNGKLSDEPGQDGNGSGYNSLHKTIGKYKRRQCSDRVQFFFHARLRHHLLKADLLCR
jgi:hypothetical protein